MCLTLWPALGVLLLSSDMALPYHHIFVLSCLVVDSCIWLTLGCLLFGEGRMCLGEREGGDKLARMEKGEIYEIVLYKRKIYFQ